MPDAFNAFVPAAGQLQVNDDTGKSANWQTFFCASQSERIRTARECAPCAAVPVCFCC